MKLTIVGSLAYDSIATDTGSVEDTLGGSAIFAGFAAARYLRSAPQFSSPEQVGLVGVVGEDFLEEDMRRLRTAGLELSGVLTEAGETFRWRGRYAGDKSQAQTLETQLNVFESFDPRVPSALVNPEIVFCANMHPRVQSRVIDQCRPRAFSAVDSMNLWISTTKDELSDLLRRFDMLILNDDEVKMLGGSSDLLESTAAIRSGAALSGGIAEGSGPSIIIIKLGARGVSASMPEGTFSLPAFPVEQVIDPTGCGDSFAGAMLVHLACSGTGHPTSARLQEALKHANVTASFTLGSFGVDALENLNDVEYEQRFESYCAML